MKTKSLRKSIAAITVGALLCLAVALFALGGKVSARAEGTDAVDIPDATLKQRIIDTLELSTATVTQNDMKRLTELDTPQNDPAKQITDLTGLEYAVNLRSLNLDYNKIEDLSPIAGLTKLESLNISYNNGATTGTGGIKDISCLRNLTALKSFSSIGNKGIEDYAVLQNFPELTYCNLAICGIRDISFLRGAVKMEKLYLSYNEISDLYPLVRMNALQTLALGNNKVADIAPVAALTTLTQLTAENNYIDDFTAVTGLRSLQKLDVSRNFLTEEQMMAIMESMEGEVIVSPVADETQKGKAFTLPATKIELKKNATKSIAVAGATYYSTDTSVATVDAEGTVTAHADGTCYVVATKDGFARGATVIVSAKGGSDPGGDPESPAKPKKKGCGCGSAIAATVSAAGGGLLLVGAGIAMLRRRKRDGQNE